MDREQTKEEFLRVYEEHGDSLFRHCYFKVSSRDIALDLTQDTFMRVWEYVSKGNQISNMRAFLFKVLNNAIIDYYRKHKTESLDAKIDEGTQFSDRNISNDVQYGAEMSLVIRAIDKLPEEYREVVFMRYINDLSPKEIAEVLEENENNVSVKIHRGVKKLKEILHI